MHSDETRALKRALLILRAVSAARWGWGLRAPAPDTASATALPELLEGTRAATEESARRRAPLGDGESIDPNTAGEVDLDRLPGVGPAAARAIVAARDSGVVYRAPEDLLVVRGIGEGTLARMRPHLKFAATVGRPGRSARRPPPPPSGAAGRVGGARIDLNTADQAALESLPGIGPSLAGRILLAREERMFSSLEDLERVPGVGPATIERLRPHATAQARP
jgi:competence protein ComEA